jgi:hypothetical protein
MFSSSRACDFCSFCELPINDRGIKHASRDSGEQCSVAIWDNNRTVVWSQLFSNTPCATCGEVNYVCLERRSCRTDSARMDWYDDLSTRHEEFERDFAAFQKQIVFEILVVNRLIMLPAVVRRHIIKNYIRRPVEFNAEAIYCDKKNKNKKKCCCF